MEKKLTIKELAPYLPYGIDISINGKIQKLNSIDSEAKLVCYGWGNAGFIDTDDVKPLLRPLSSLTEEINWGNQTYAITDLFEIGDDGGYIYEYDHGNIKLISQLKTIAEYNYHHDINYLPYPVVQVLIEHHFDIFGLIDRCLALPIDGKEVES